MTAPYFHIGILVADLDRAIVDFSRALGVDFNPPSVMPVSVTGDEGPSPREVRATYSRQGPPYIELMQGQPSGFLSLENGEGFHHIGLWCPANTSVADHARYGDLGPAVCVNGTAQQLTRRALLHGVALELVDETNRTAIEAWINQDLAQPGSPPSSPVKPIGTEF